MHIGFGAAEGSINRLNWRALLGGGRADAGASAERHRATEQQVADTRGAAVKFARCFRVREAEKAGLAGQQVLLADDVLTTGATVGMPCRCCVPVRC